MPTADEIVDQKPPKFYRLLTECVKVAERRETISYKDAGKLIEVIPIGMHPWVGALSREMAEHDLPMLSAVVVGKDDGIPGEGFYEEAANLNKDNLPKDPEQMSREEKIEFWKDELHRVYDTFSR